MQKSPRFWITAAASAGFLALAPMALAATPANMPAEHATTSQPAEHSTMNSHATTAKPMTTAQNTTKHESSSSKTMSSEHAPAHSTHMKSETAAHSK